MTDTTKMIIGYLFSKGHIASVLHDKTSPEGIYEFTSGKRVYSLKELDCQTSIKIQNKAVQIGSGTMLTISRESRYISAYVADTEKYTVDIDGTVNNMFKTLKSK